MNTLCSANNILPLFLSFTYEQSTCCVWLIWNTTKRSSDVPELAQRSRQLRLRRATFYFLRLKDTTEDTPCMIFCIFWAFLYSNSLASSSPIGSSLTGGEILNCNGNRRLYITFKIWPRGDSTTSQLHDLLLQNIIHNNSTTNACISQVFPSPGIFRYTFLYFPLA